jgi:hypothetical protein
VVRTLALKTCSFAFASATFRLRSLDADTRAFVPKAANPAAFVASRIHR